MLCSDAIKPHCEWVGECSTSLIYLNNDREVPAVIFLSRSIRGLCWSSHPSSAHFEIPSTHPRWSPYFQTDWEDWEPSALSAPPRKGPPTVCPVLQRLQKQVGTPVFPCFSWKHLNSANSLFENVFPPSLPACAPSCPSSHEPPGSSLQHGELFCPSAQHIRQQQSVFFWSQRPHRLTAGCTKTRGHRQPVSGQHRPHEGKDLCYFKKRF